MPRILIVDHSPAFCDMLGAIILGLGHTVDYATTISDGLASVHACDIDVLFLNASLSDGNGIDALPKFRACPSMPEIIITVDTSDPDSAERAIRQGAWEYVEKSAAVDTIILPLIRALDYREKKPARGKNKETRKLNRSNIIGSGPGLNRCLDIVSEAAASDASALLYGETGVGKEVFARCIHENSDRAAGPFVAVDCASLSRTLAGSFLFGHKKGAFTGADKDKEGLVLQANKGTLFLDEVGELPLAMQKMFLRVLQEHRFRPVGGRNELISDFRLICATNRNLEEMANKGTFRSDLLFRMRTVVMPIPPLRERTEDIEDLTTHYVHRICGKYGMPAKPLSPDVLDSLRRHQWPGNVRELMHTLERAVLAAQDTPMLFARHLPDHIRISIARADATVTTADSPHHATHPNTINLNNARDNKALSEAAHLPATDKQSAPLNTSRPHTTSTPHMTGSPHTGNEEIPAHITAPSCPCLPREQEPLRRNQCPLGTAHSPRAQSQNPDQSLTDFFEAHAASTPPPHIQTPALDETSTHLHQTTAPAINKTSQPAIKTRSSTCTQTVHPHGFQARASKFHSLRNSKPHPPATVAPQTLFRPLNSTLEHHSAHTQYQHQTSLLDEICSAVSNTNELPPFFELRDTLFREYLIKLLDQCEGKMTHACKHAGVSRSYLYDLLKKYDISPRR